MVSETNTIDWNATAAWIALAVSIVTPTISLLLSNIHQRKLKKLELKNALILLQPYSLLPCQYDMMQNNVVTIHIGTMFNSFILLLLHCQTHLSIFSVNLFF